MNLSTPQTISISCFNGLRPYLEEEVKALGFVVTNPHDTGLETTGTLEDTMRLNLSLRTALHVMILLKDFRCTSPDQLYKNVNNLAWERLIAPEEYLTVVSRVNTGAVNNSMFASVKVKDAVVDRIQEKTGRRPDSGPERENVVINLFWREDRCWLYLNTSGRKLSDRGYRRMPWQAPLREPLAAGIIMATGYDGSVPLVLPMCGSGTLAIEAALLATGRAPGLLRSNYGFTHLQDYPKDAWEALRRDLLKSSRGSARPAPIIATDNHPDAIDAGKRNAMTAGVDHLIEWKICDFADTPIPEEPGIIVMNPEYGERLGELSRLQATYRRIGDWFKQSCPGWTGYVFTGNLPLGKQVGLKASRRIPFWNAKIECRLFKYEMYAGSKKNLDTATAPANEKQPDESSEPTD